MDQCGAVLGGVGGILVVALVLVGWRFNALGIRTASPFASVAVAFDGAEPYGATGWRFSFRALTIAGSSA